MPVSSGNDRERHDKIANMQRLVDDARRSGVSDLTVPDIRKLALKASATPRR